MTEKPFLNTLRWTSAALVMVGHSAAWTFMLMPNQRIAPGLLELPKYLVDLGQSAVMIFFVVSGYLVGGGVLQAADQFSWRRYSIARFSRIYVVVIPALLLTAALDGAAHYLAPANPIYSAPWGWIPKAVFGSYGAREILASVTSLESLIGEPMGSDRPLWSLGFEWAFYFILPLAFMIARRLTTSQIGRLAICGAVALPLAAVHLRWAAIYWLIWFGGAVASRYRAPRAIALAGLAVWGLSFAAAPFLPQGLSDVLQGAGLACFVSWPACMALHVNKTLDRHLANLSFSLYVTHMPVLTFAVFMFWRAGWFPLGRFGFGFAGLAWWAGAATLAIGVALIFSILFEERTDAVRRFLGARLLQKTQEPAPVEP